MNFDMYVLLFFLVLLHLYQFGIHLLNVSVAPELSTFGGLCTLEYKTFDAAIIVTVYLYLLYKHKIISMLV